MTPTESKMLQEIRRNLEQNRVKQALTTCRQLNTQFPRNAEGWCAASVIAGKLGNLERALEFVEKALQLIPERAKFLVAKANLFLAANRIPEAAELAKQIARSSKEDPQSQDMAGGIFSRCGDHESAHQCYERAVALAPNNSAHHYNLAAVKRFLGDDRGAEAAWDKVISLNPKDYEAYHLRSDLRKQTPESNHIGALQSLIKKGISDWRGEVSICFALAKECEDIEEYRESFAWLQRGADLRRGHMSYQVENDLETIDKIIQVYSEQSYTAIAEGYGNSEPIFIVGLPRTGTTLVDRIVSSHDQVHSAGELNSFALAMTRLAQSEAGRKLPRMELVEQTAKIDFNALGRAYIDSTRGVVDNTRCFTDKMPLNFLYCGLIHRALPQAKIIHVTRSPMDACYAIYKRLFKDAYPMSYNLDDLGRYYLAYRRLMRHWYQLMPGVIHPVSYEELINDQEATSRRLIEHCGLEWQNECLRFEKNRAPSTTASASQVRQPIYRSSLAKWRHYEKQLAPLQERLRSAGVDIETAPF